MERAEWLKQMRDKAEVLYDHLSPKYWVTFGLYANETHREYLQKFLGRVAPRSTLLAEADEVEEAYERAKARGLPVVFGEVVDQVEEAYERVKALGLPEVSGELADVAVYHYCPSLEQVRAWIGQAGLAIAEEGTGNGYEHFVVRKR